MTVPGELDKVPIKVVPIYIEPVSEQEEPLEREVVVEPEPEDAPRRPVQVLGRLSALVAVATAIITGIGVGVASTGGYEAGTVLAWVAIILSASSVLGGLVAVIGNWGRPAGVAAIIVGLCANPWLLATVLGALAG